ncbi:UPF0481 protein-like [Iris pallida]|uniref:UPF0481 protein-like n=1 Tax=Iris pallida TaxID=29817 RepID=A0AAX6FQE2_IRIPA|nr:UPF0481 protein-like [Iris pallida]
MGSEGYFVMMDPEEEWMVSLRKKVEHAAFRKHRRDNPPTIFRVPAAMRRGGAAGAAYTPKVISIGPYHRDDPALKPMDELKLLYLHKLLLRNPGVALEDYVELVRGLEAQARASYHDDVGMCSDRFVETMLLDGCFVVELFLMQLDGKGEDDQYDDPNLSTVWTFPLVQYDLLMLENQIPYVVLLHIYHLATTPPSYRGDYYYLSQLAHAFFNNHLPRDRLVIPPEDVVPQYHHLLHFFHSCIMPEGYRHKLLDVSSTTNRPAPLYRRGSVPSATRLKEAGIVFKAKEGADSFLDVGFRDGVMEIPTLKVYDHTECLFRNLIAFEQCFPGAGGYFGAYAMMMDCLISAPEDAALLHRYGCIASGLGDPGCAARLFNDLRKDAAADRRSCYLSAAFEGMRRHCDSRWNRWRAKLMRDYFGNPWSVLSLAAALVLIFLTVVQALFSVLSITNLLLKDIV